MEDDAFDTEYEEVKNTIDENLGLIRNECDARIIQEWILKLEKGSDCPDMKATRNEYARYLVHQLQRQSLHRPFTKQPPEGPLLPLSQVLEPTKCSAQIHTYVEPETPPQTCAPCRIPVREHLMEENTKKAGLIEWPTKVTHKTPAQSHQYQQERICGSKMFPCARPQKPTASLPEDYLLKMAAEDDCPFTSEPPCLGDDERTLEKKIANMSDTTDLYEFMNEISPYTTDMGEAMLTVTSDEIAKFKEFVRSVYFTRQRESEELLMKEQIKLKIRYEAWESKVLKQAQAALRSLQLTLPHFNYDKFKMDPEYLHNMLKMQLLSNDAKGSNSNQARNIRAKAQNKTWFNEEAQRIEKGNLEKMIEMRQVNAYLAALSKSYHDTHANLSEQNKCLEDEAAQLRIRYEENQKLLDRLTDKLNTAARDY